MPTMSGALAMNDRDKPDTATDGDAPHAISGWNGASYSVAGTDRDTTMTVVYDNKATATSGTFNKRFTIIPGHLR